MADQIVTLPTDASNTGKKVDVSELTVNAQTVERQRVIIGDNSTAANYLTINANGAAVIQGYAPAVVTQSGIVATGAQAAQSANGYNIVTITLRTFTGTSPSVTWKVQASDDNTNWVDLQGLNNATGQLGTSWTQASALTAGTAGPSIDYTIGGYTQIRINVTAISGTSATAAFGIALQTMPYETAPGAMCHGTDGSVTRPLLTDTTGRVATTPTDGYKATYSAAAVAYAPAATPTDVGELIGSSTKTIRITKIIVHGFSGTTAGAMDVQILKRSTANSAGTVAALTAVPMDSNNAAASATCNKVTVNRTLGNVVGSAIVAAKIPMLLAANTLPPMVFDFGKTGQCIVLRGTAQMCVINLNGGTVPSGGQIAYSFEWTEE